MYQRTVIALIGYSLLLISCRSQPLATAEPRIAVTNTATAHPTASPVTSAPEPSFEPANTPVPTPAPLQWPFQPITKDNASAIREISRWGLGSVQRIQTLNSRDGEFLVLTPLGVYLYQSVSPQMLAFIPDADEFTLSPDESLLAVSLKNGNVQIWNMDPISLAETFTHSFPEDITSKIKERKLLPFYVGGMAFSPDSSEIAIGYADGSVELYRLGEPAPYATLRHDAFALLEGDIGLIFQLGYSPDGKTLTIFKLASSINSNRLTFWSLPEAELMAVSEAGRFYDFADSGYLPDNQTLLVFSRDGSYFSLTLWNILTGTKLGKFDTGLAKIDSAELVPNGMELTMYGSDAQESYFRQVRVLPEGKLLENEKIDQLPENKDWASLRDLLFEKGHYYNSWSDEELGDVQVAALEGGGFRLLRESDWLMFPGGTISPLTIPQDTSSLFYDPQGHYVAWCTPGNLNFLDAEGFFVVELAFITNCDGVTISHQRRYAAIWYGESMYIANLEAGTFSKLSFDRRWRTTTIAAGFSHDEKILVTSRLGLISIWQVDPPQKLTDTSQVGAGVYMGNNIEVVISKDSSFAVTLNANDQIGTSRESALMVWRTADAFTLHRINPPVIESGQPKFTSFALSPDDQLIVSGDDFGGIRLWDVQTGEEIAFFDIEARPLDVSFTPEGSGLLIVLGDGTIRLWGIP